MARQTEPITPENLKRLGFHLEEAPYWGRVHDVYHHFDKDLYINFLNTGITADFGECERFFYVNNMRDIKTLLNSKLPEFN